MKEKPCKTCPDFFATPGDPDGKTGLCERSGLWHYRFSAKCDYESSQPPAPATAAPRLDEVTQDIDSMVPWYEEDR